MNKKKEKAFSQREGTPTRGKRKLDQMEGSRGFLILFKVRICLLTSQQLEDQSPHLFGVGKAESSDQASQSEQNICKEEDGVPTRLDSQGSLSEGNSVNHRCLCLLYRWRWIHLSFSYGSCI